MLSHPVGPVHVKATLDGMAHWATYLRQFKDAASANQWTVKKKVISLVPAFEEPVVDLLRKVPPHSRIAYAELIRAVFLK